MPRDKDSKEKEGRNAFGKVKDWGKSLASKHQGENSAWPLGGPDNARSHTSLSNRPNDAPTALPIYNASRYQIPEEDRLDVRFGEGFNAYINAPNPRTPPYPAETGYIGSPSKALTARNEIFETSGRNVPLSRSSFDTSGNFQVQRRPTPGERQLSNDSLKRGLRQQKQLQLEYPDGLGKVEDPAKDYHESNDFMGRLSALTGYSRTNGSTAFATRLDSSRDGTRSPVLSVSSLRDLRSGEASTFFNATQSDIEDRLDNEDVIVPQIQQGMRPDEASMSEREMASNDGLRKTRLRHLVYQRFCAEFEELRDEKKNNHQHKVAKWVAKEAEKILRQDVKEAGQVMDQKNAEMRQMQAQLADAIAQKELLDSVYRTEIEAEKNRSAEAMKQAGENFRAEVKKQVTENMAQIQKKHQYDLDKAKQNIEALERQNKQAISKKTDEFDRAERRHRDESDRKDQKIAYKDSELERKQRTIENNRIEYTTRLNDKIHALEEKDREWGAALQRERDNSAREKKALEQTHADTIEQIEEANKAAIKKRDEHYAADRAVLIEEHEREKRTLRAHVEKIENEAERMEEGWKAKNVRDLDEQRRSLTAEKKTEVTRLEGIVQDMITKHEQETQAAEQKHAEGIREAEQKQANEKSQLQKQLLEQNKALLSRDDEEYNLRSAETGMAAFPQKTDEAIQSSFQEIQDLVDELSEMQWRTDQRMWTPQVLQKVGRNQVQRLLRKAILQDLVWTVLFHGIFCSPFRVFGAEGEALERQWVKSFGGHDDPYQDGFYRWPAPGIESERWRYMTIRECNKVLRNPVPSKWDPRAELKKDFKGSYDELVSRLRDVVGDIAEIEVESMETIKKLARRTAGIWIDLEMHRCRIVVRLTGTNSRTTTDKVKLAQKGSLTLTKAPEIGRYGNVEGLDLDTFTVIDGCAGETLKIP